MGELQDRIGTQVEEERRADERRRAHAKAVTKPTSLALEFIELMAAGEVPTASLWTRWRTDQRAHPDNRLPGWRLFEATCTFILEGWPYWGGNDGWGDPDPSSRRFEGLFAKDGLYYPVTSSQKSAQILPWGMGAIESFVAFESPAGIRRFDSSTNRTFVIFESKSEGNPSNSPWSADDLARVARILADGGSSAGGYGKFYDQSDNSPTASRNTAPPGPPPTRARRTSPLPAKVLASPKPKRHWWQ